MWDAKPDGVFARVRLPTIARSVLDMTQEDRAASASLLKLAGQLRHDVERGMPTATLAAEASELFQQLQGRDLAPQDASGICTSLEVARGVMASSPAFVQGPLIPVHQSEAEGQISRSLDLVELAVQVAEGHGRG